MWPVPWCIRQELHCERLRNAARPAQPAGDVEGCRRRPGQAGSNGAFVLPAPPGNYTPLSLPPSKKQSCGATAVTVSAGQYTNTLVHCH